MLTSAKHPRCALYPANTPSHLRLVGWEPGLPEHLPAQLIVVLIGPHFLGIPMTLETCLHAIIGVSAWEGAKRAQNAWHGRCDAGVCRSGRRTWTPMNAMIRFLPSSSFPAAPCRAEAGASCHDGTTTPWPSSLLARVTALPAARTSETLVRLSLAVAGMVSGCEPSASRAPSASVLLLILKTAKGHAKARNSSVHTSRSPILSTPPTGSAKATRFEWSFRGSLK